MDTTRIHHRPDDTVEAHYASLARLEECRHCYGSGAVLLTIEEDGQEHIEPVRCRRCNGETR